MTGPLGRHAIVRLFLVWLAGTCAIELLMRMPGIPYNVRELGSSDWPLVGPAWLSATGLVILGAPAWIARSLAGRRHQVVLLPLYVLAHSVLVAWLVLEVMPTESVHDVVGSPILRWPGQWEAMGRFAGLFCLVSALLVSCCLLVIRPHDLRQWLSRVAAIVPCLVIAVVLSYWVVVVKACTDNITELLASQGTLAGWLALTVGGGLMAVTGSWLASLTSERSLQKWLLVPVVVPLTAIGIYALWTLALNPAVVKYGQTFSALQFLLSANRASLATGTDLLLRFGSACVASIIAIAVAQYPWMLHSPTRLARQSSRVLSAVVVCILAVATGGAGLPVVPPPVARVIPLPDFQGACAIWGAMGHDRRGHIWMGVTSNDDKTPSARLFEFDPASGTVVDRGNVLGELERLGLKRPGEKQMKIHSRIAQMPDDNLYFASMDESGENADGSRLPDWGGHLWRVGPSGRWEHLAAAREALIAVAGGGPFVYALGYFNHVVYQYDTRTGAVKAKTVGAAGGHVSRNFFADERGHVFYDSAAVKLL